MTRVDGSQLSKQDIVSLRDSVKGKVITKVESHGSAEYKEAIKRWNMMHVKEAQIIVFVEGEEDLVNTLRFVTKHNIDVAISCGRHTYSGPSSGHGLIVGKARHC